MILRMLWVTMGMYVPFLAQSLTLRPCPCVETFRCNPIWNAFTSIHVTMSHCFHSAIVLFCAHKLRCSGWPFIALCILPDVLCEASTLCHCVELGCFG